MRVKDKIVIITGAASGIGMATSILFVKEGATVIAIDINEEELNCLSTYSKSIETYKLDVTDRKQCKETFEAIINKYRRIDCLINNAGIYNDYSFHKMSEEQWDSVINVNLKGVFNMTQLVTPVMKKQKYGSIMMTGSMVAFYGNPGQANYAAAKAGLLGMTYTLAKEYGKHGIRVNAVIPGFIRTKMTSKLKNEIKKYLIKNTPLGRCGEPEDVAYTFLFLASDEANFITGQAICVNGGIIF